MAELAQSAPHRDGVFPVVGGTGIEWVGGANESSRFDPGDIRRLASGEVAPGSQVIVDLREGALVHHEVDEFLGFTVRSVAPHNIVGLEQSGGFVDPLLNVNGSGRGLGGGVSLVKSHRHNRSWVVV